MSNGEYFEGTFSRDKVHGQGKFYSFRNGGEIVRGMWNQGILVKVIEVIPKRKIQFVQMKADEENQTLSNGNQFSHEEEYESV
jgi:hypothetical protein